MPGANVIPFADNQLVTPANATELGVIASGQMAKTSDLFVKLKMQFRRDARASEKWRREARKWYAMRDGKQWDNDTLVKLKDEQRPALTFNRIKAVLNVVSGIEISNRQEIAVYPRQEGDTKVSDQGTEALKWLDDRCQADTEESRAFLDMTTCGIGVTETRIDYLDDPQGKTYRERVFPLSVFWDANAIKRNLTDAKRVWRVKVIELDEAMEMFPDTDPFDFDADWTGLTIDNVTEQIDERVRDYRQDNHSGMKDWTKPVRLVQVQWWERAYRFMVKGPEGEFEVDKQDVRLYRGLSQFQIRRVPYRKYFYAIIGRSILQQGELDPGDRFHFQFMTGDYDENEGFWYGLVRPMVDPQQWANKTLSNIVHILSTMRKGGILYETDFFVDEEKGKRDLAKPNPAIQVTRGSLSNPTGGAEKYRELSVGQLPQGVGDLLEFSKRSIYECAGVPFELLSQDVSDQLSGVQEYERKRAGITMLAGYFDSLRLYRIQQAELSFDFLQAFHQGALIRLFVTDDQTNEQLERFVPLILDDEVQDYDFVIDDSPTSPNQKERTWQLLLPLIPAFIQVGAPPEMLQELLRASPLPQQVVERIIGSSEETPEEQQQRELLMRQVLAELAKTESEARENLAQAQKAAADAVYSQARAQDLGYRQSLDTIETMSEIEMAREVPPDRKSVVDIQ